jgi:hypothetical protein
MVLCRRPAAQPCPLSPAPSQAAAHPRPAYGELWRAHPARASLPWACEMSKSSCGPCRAGRPRYVRLQPRGAPSERGSQPSVLAASALNRSEQKRGNRLYYSNRKHILQWYKNQKIKKGRFYKTKPISPLEATYFSSGGRNLRTKPCHLSPVTYNLRGACLPGV